MVLVATAGADAEKGMARVIAIAQVRIDGRSSAFCGAGIEDRRRLRVGGCHCERGPAGSEKSNLQPVRFVAANGEQRRRLETERRANEPLVAVASARGKSRTGNDGADKREEAARLVP